MDLEIPLAWSPELCPRASAIEVYPAATLIAHSLRASGYKDSDRKTERTEMVSELGSRMEIRAQHVQLAEANADLLDALVCVLAGDDFLVPQDMTKAEKEGWIWFRQPDSR